MAHIKPFAGIHYSKTAGLEMSRIIAPPYDVLNEQQKGSLQARHPHNIVNIDLPHLPPKTAGPDETYEKSNVTLQAWLSGGVLKRDHRRALYPYTQSFKHGERTYHRRGFFALVRLSPFGAGQVVPHEKTYKGAIEDRLKLMRATGVQLSPIFGLYSDAKNEITGLLYHNLARPELSGTLDGVQNDLWSIIDAELENQVIDLMGQRPIYIADGHHRYTTALQFQYEAEQKNGGVLPPHHPANFCMFVLVGMQDDGLLILPTHRLIGGLYGFEIGAFEAAVREHFEITGLAVPPERIAEAAQALSAESLHTFGLYDGKTKTLYRLSLKNPEVLAALEPAKSEAWRRLDVAILQRYLLDEVIQPKFAGGKELTKGYSADAKSIPAEVDGKKYQIALLLRPTPLHALEDLGRHGEVMPQKSTYFYPKLATGMIMNPLR